LLTADDLGRAKEESNEHARARQNVIFEMGYFMGKLGRERVFVLLDDGVEKPSDIDGIVYNNVDTSWSYNLVKELKACGYDVDANKLIE
jgi:predicted nucleotide-binding protein